jgi:ABC-2 type transport system permease protein
MKAIDIAIKDLVSAFRNATALLFMFGIPLLVTGMFYLMFGNIASQGEFNLSKIHLVVANLDQDAPVLKMGAGNVPGGIKANTMSDLVVEILGSEEMEDLLEVTHASTSVEAHQAVDNRQADVAIVIPDGFSRQFADIYSQSTIEFYRDPTLTLGSGIVRSILNQFMDGLSGTKIAVSVAVEQAGIVDSATIGEIVGQYLESSPAQAEKLSEELLDERPPGKPPESDNPLLRIISPIMGGMMIFYAFYSGTATAQSILTEEERRTLQRLFTTPTSQSTILTGKFLAVFLTVLVQMAVLLAAARLIFKIQWGNPFSIMLVAAGTILVSSTFGIFVNSMMKDTKQSGVIFGGVLTITGMLGMISIFAMNSPSAARLGNTVSLLVPQGWAVRGFLQAMNQRSVQEVLVTVLVMLIWSSVFFSVGVWRFRRRYV